MAALPVLLLAGPSLLLRWLTSKGWPFLIAALSVYLVYFLGSAALALAIRKEIQVYLIGLPLFTFLLLLLAMFAAAGFADPETSSLYMKTLSCVSLLLALLWAAVSLRAFCRGEVHLGRSRARTLAEAGLASAALLVVALTACSNSTLAALGGIWIPETPEGEGPYNMKLRPTSDDGRFVFIQQRLRERPGFTRLAVVDLENGRVTRWLERPGIYQVSWSASEPVLNVLAYATPSECPICTGLTFWYRLSPDLQVLSIRKLPGTGFIRQLGSGLLLVTRQWRTVRIYLLSDRDGSFAEILSRESEDNPLAWTLEEGALVVFPATTTLSAWWLDPHGRIRHEGSTRRKSGQTYYFVGRRILFLEEVLAEARQRDLPPLSSRQRSWEILLPDADGPLDFSSGRFYLERHTNTGFIWWRDEERGTWTRIPEEFHLADLGRLKSRLSLPFPGFINYQLSGLPLARVDLDNRTGILAAVLLSEGHRQLLFFDGRLGRSIPSPVACAGEEGATSLSLTQMQGLEGLLVRFACWDQTGRVLESRLLEVVPGSGRVRDLSRLSPIAESEHFGQWIYLNPEGASVWLSKTGEVWQAGPGRRRLRLNPPSR